MQLLRIGTIGTIALSNSAAFSKPLANQDRFENYCRLTFVPANHMEGCW